MSAGQSWKTISGSRQVVDEEEVDVKLTYGVGVLTLSAGDAGMLYRTRLTFDEEAATPVSEYRDGDLQLASPGTGVSPST